MSNYHLYEDADEPVEVAWPPALREEPDYPELEPQRIDLAADTISAALTAGARLRLVKG